MWYHGCSIHYIYFNEDGQWSVSEYNIGHYDLGLKKYYCISALKCTHWICWTTCKKYYWWISIRYLNLSLLSCNQIHCLITVIWTEGFYRYLTGHYCVFSVKIILKNLSLRGIIIVNKCCRWILTNTHLHTHAYVYKYFIVCISLAHLCPPSFLYTLILLPS